MSKVFRSQVTLVTTHLKGSGVQGAARIPGQWLPEDGGIEGFRFDVTSSQNKSNKQTRHLCRASRCLGPSPSVQVPSPEFTSKRSPSAPSRGESIINKLFVTSLKPAPEADSLLVYKSFTFGLEFLIGREWPTAHALVLPDAVRASPHSRPLELSPLTFLNIDLD